MLSAQQLELLLRGGLVLRYYPVAGIVQTGLQWHFLARDLTDSLRRQFVLGEGSREPLEMRNDQLEPGTVLCRLKLVQDGLSHSVILFQKRINRSHFAQIAAV